MVIFTDEESSEKEQIYFGGPEKDGLDARYMEFELPYENTVEIFISR